MAGCRLIIYMAGDSLVIAGGWLVIYTRALFMLHHIAGGTAWHTFHSGGRLVF